MAIAPPSHKTPRIRTGLLTPPPNPPHTLIQIGFEDDDEERNWFEDIMEEGEVEMGCDWSDGPLAPGGCRW